MKKIIVYGLAVTMSISLLGCGAKDKVDALVNEPQVKIEKEVDLDKLNEDTIIKLVEDFGSQLKKVSLLSPLEDLEKSMRENYGDYVDDELIDKWLGNLDEAPGRLLSSPWPEKIEILKLEKVSDEEYIVEGKIVEVTSVEGEEITRPITLSIKSIGDTWLIHDADLGDYEE